MNMRYSKIPGDWGGGGAYSSTAPPCSTMNTYLIFTKVINYCVYTSDILYFLDFEYRSYFEIGEIIPFTPWLEAGHAEDLIFVFGMPFIEQLAGIHGHNLTDAEKAMSVQVMRYWTNFAKSG